MARLEAGVDLKIDKINGLVSITKDPLSSQEAKTGCIEELLKMFRPMLIKSCSKWIKYFDSCMPSHMKVKFSQLKSFDSLMSDAEYWFMVYTWDKYEIDGDATYNNFIKKHIDQRVRYICECEMGYYIKNSFPDPNRNGEDGDSVDMFETVAYNYSSSVSDTISIEDDVVDTIMDNDRIKLAQKVMSIVENGNFNEREKMIFRQVICEGMTQEEMSRKLNVSRMRVIQILKKIKTKLYKAMDNNNDIWDLIDKTDIRFDER